MRPRSPLLVVLATVLGLALLALAIRHLDGAAVGAALGRARLWPWLPLGIASYLTGHGLRGVRLRRLLRHEVALTTPTATNVVVVGYATNNVLPARLGEVVRAWFLMERSGLSITQTLTVTLVERLLDAGTLLVLFGLAALVLPQGPVLAAAFPIALVLLAIVAAALALGVWAPGAVIGFATRATQRLSARSQEALLRQVHAALGGLEALRHVRGAGAIVAGSFLVWLAEAGLYWAMLPAFGLEAKPIHAVFAMTGTNLGLLLPSTPGFVGTFHFFCTESLFALGVPRTLGFGYAVVVHAAFFVPVTLWGTAVLASQGLSFGRALALSREAEPMVPGTAPMPARAVPVPEAPPSRFLAALAEAAVPLHADGLDAGAAPEVVTHVARFVGGQMRELPFRLRALFHAGLAGFRLATRLRYARGYCELPAALRRRWFERWAYGRWALARQLFRPVRSTALLAYYERPEVRAALAAHERTGPAVEWSPR